MDMSATTVIARSRPTRLPSCRTLPTKSAGALASPNQDSSPNHRSGFCQGMSFSAAPRPSNQPTRSLTRIMDESIRAEHPGRLAGRVMPTPPP